MIWTIVVLVLAACSDVWSKPLQVSLKAPSAILINAETGCILYEKESHQKSFPASTTKIATALYILEKYGHRLDDVVAASHYALSIVPAYQRHMPEFNHPPYRLEAGGSNMGIKTGELLSLNTLLHGLMLSSGNDAANVLAESLGGSIDLFMNELNRFLQSQGILETHFVNPHGLHHADHWTTAADLAAMTRLAMKHPAFRAVVKTTHFLRPQTNKQPSNTIVQTNRLLKAGAYYYPKAIGVKTGYTSQAGYTLVGAATHEGRTLIAVLLNCEDTHQRFREAIKLFDAAFAEKPVVRVLFPKESEMFSHAMRGASSPIRAALHDDLVVKYYPAEEPLYRAEVHWTSRELPIHQGDRVGEIHVVTADGVRLNKQPLYALADVNPRWWVYLRDYKPLLLGLFLGGQVVLVVVYLIKKSKKGSASP